MAWSHGELSPSNVPGERLPAREGDLARTNWPQLGVEKCRELECSAEEPQHTLVLRDGEYTASGRN